MTTREIILSRGLTAIVDAADFEWLSQWKWSASVEYSGTFYAVRNEKLGVNKWRGIYMHRSIIGAALGQIVDHRDHDGLHNFRSNLRISTKAENGRNRRGSVSGSSSQYLGVCYRKAGGDWLAQICENGASRYIGIFPDEAAAARAYDAEAIKLYGEYASCNFPTNPDRGHEAPDAAGNFNSPVGPAAIDSTVTA